MNTRPWIHTTLTAVLGITLIVGGCRSRTSTEEIAEAIRQKLAAGEAPTARAQWADVQKVYAQHASPLWVMGEAVDARQALEVIRSAADHGLNPSDYGVEEIAAQVEAEPDKAKPKTPDELASLDVLVTGALLQLGHDVAFGRISPEAVNREWKSQREPQDLTASLAQAASGNGLAGWLNSIRPQHPGYAALQAELKRLRQPEADAATTTPAPSVDGGEGPSVEERAHIIAMNLERWRWVPDDLGSTHVLVNVPAYRLVVQDNGQTPLTMRVVVGEPDKRTPIFSGKMSTVVFSPYWNIPDSIIEGEIAAVAARDPNYLRRNNIDILKVTKDGVQEVSPGQVDWNDEEALKGLSFRQRPGAINALGHVKFLFPNKYNVYLHDTPADALFARPVRALSHGCIRLEKPDELAAFVLRHDAKWDQKSIHDAMYSGDEKQVPLKPSIPVHIVYMTAWVDEASTVQFSPDVYGYDAVQAKLD